MYVCADHVLPRGLPVEYSGWNAYGADVHVLAAGVYSTWAKPLAVDAVIEPLSPLVRSVRSIRKPAGVSYMWIRMRSPGFISRSLLRFGFTAEKLGAENVPVNSGSAGACETPLFVT